MLIETGITGETQPKQARSIARKQVLLDHGVELFNAKGLDDISIQEITQAVGFSTGSFYSYFADKTEYFVAVQSAVATVQDGLVKSLFAAGRIARLSSVDRLHLCIDFAITFFRQHTGLVHAALSYERRVPEGWLPHRRTTETIIQHACAGLTGGEAQKLKIAIQLTFGLLVNTLLHDPGPLRLADDDLASQILRAMTPYLGT